MGGQICLRVAFCLLGANWGKMERHKHISQEISGKCRDSPRKSREAFVFTCSLVCWAFLAPIVKFVWWHFSGSRRNLQLQCQGTYQKKSERIILGIIVAEGAHLMEDKGIVFLGLLAWLLTLLHFQQENACAFSEIQYTYTYVNNSEHHRVKKDTHTSLLSEEFVLQVCQEIRIHIHAISWSTNWKSTYIYIYMLPYYIYAPYI